MSDRPPDAKTTEERVTDERTLGEGPLAELLLARPTRFSEERSATDVLLLGALSLVCFLPLGPLAVLRAIRCSDRYRDAELPTPWTAWVGAGLGVIATVVQLAALATWLR